jgi:hypothetical protein
VSDPDPEVVAVISAALDQVWPRPALPSATGRDLSHTAWRFSGRWWHRPTPMARARP